MTQTAQVSSKLIPAQKHQGVIEAFVIKQSRLEMYLSLKNVITFYLMSFVDLTEKNVAYCDGCENLLKCQHLLTTLFEENKDQFDDDVKIFLKDFIMEIESVKKLLENNPLKRYSPELKSSLDSKRFILEYLFSSLKNSINLKNSVTAAHGSF